MVGEFYFLIKEEKIKYEIDLSDREIAKMSKNQFKRYVKNKVEKFAFSHLVSLGENHSKSQKIIQSMKSNKFTTQPYILSLQLTNEQKILLFSLRTKSYDVKASFKKKYSGNMTCRSCNLVDSYEDLEHLIKCSVLNDNKHSLAELNTEDIYGSIEDQTRFIKFFVKLHLKRKLLAEVQS